MAVNSTEIQKIANLARLQITEDESTRMLGQINGFFDIVEKMQSVDTTGVVPMSHPTDAANAALMHAMTLRLRDDVVSEPNNREANQQSAPAVERGLFLVPKVIE